MARASSGAEASFSRPPAQENRALKVSPPAASAPPMVAMDGPRSTGWISPAAMASAADNTSSNGPTSMSPACAVV